MLHGQMLHRQMLHGQILHGQLLHRQILHGQVTWTKVSHIAVAVIFMVEGKLCLSQRNLKVLQVNPAYVCFLPVSSVTVAQHNISFVLHFVFTGQWSLSLQLQVFGILC